MSNISSTFPLLSMTKAPKGFQDPIYPKGYTVWKPQVPVLKAPTPADAAVKQVQKELEKLSLKK
jgi:hypothetical protein